MPRYIILSCSVFLQMILELKCTKILSLLNASNMISEFNPLDHCDDVKDSNQSFHIKRLSKEIQLSITRFSRLMLLLSVPSAEERVGTTTAILQHCSHVVLAEQ